MIDSSKIVEFKPRTKPSSLSTAMGTKFDYKFLDHTFFQLSYSNEPVLIVLVETGDNRVTGYMGTGIDRNVVAAQGVRLNKEQAQAMFGYKIKNYR